MKQETKKLTVPVYRTPTGRPTCVADVATGKGCIFFRTTNFGSRETCVFAPEDSLFGLESIPRVQGYLDPPRWCLLWAGEERETQI
jgi:hypothetical protein